MPFAYDGEQRWGQLDNARKGLITRCEKYAGLTLPKYCLPDHFNLNNQEIGRDFQSVGAQAVNHLVNKLMLALFAPSRPFFRLDPTADLRALMAEIDLPEEEVANTLALAEKQAVTQMDRMALRPKIFELLKHIVITGNVCAILGATMLIKGLKDYVVRRSMSGQLVEGMVRFRVKFDELELPVQEYMMTKPRYKNMNAEQRSDLDVSLYHWIRRNYAGDYEVTQWVDRDLLNADMWRGQYTEEDLPYHFLTWDLADGQHYGTGLVEDYSGDLAALSMMSRSIVTGALMASEYRWLVNPAGQTNVEDFNSSENGEAIPGQKDDVSIVQSNKQGDLQIVNSIAQDYIRRIGMGFLMMNAITRDAERVTAEEIRLQANELETGLGGGYSRLAVGFQLPFSRWLVKMIGINVEGHQVEPTVVTGLEALSRQGDLDDLMQTLSDAAALAQLPETLQDRLKQDAIFSEIGAGRRVDTSKWIMSDQEYETKVNARMAAQVQAQQAVDNNAAANEVAVNNSTQGA